MESQVFNKNNCGIKRRNKLSTLNLLFNSPSEKYMFIIKHSNIPIFIFSIFFTLKNSLMLHKSTYIPNLNYAKKFKENNLFVSETFDFFKFFNQKIVFKSIIFFNIKLSDFEIEFLNEFSLLNKKLVIIFSDFIELNKWKVNLLNKISTNNISLNELTLKNSRGEEIYNFNGQLFLIQNYKIILK